MASSREPSICVASGPVSRSVPTSRIVLPSNRMSTSGCSPRSSSVVSACTCRMIVCAPRSGPVVMISSFLPIVVTANGARGNADGSCPRRDERGELAGETGRGGELELLVTAGDLREPGRGQPLLVGAVGQRRRAVVERRRVARHELALAPAHRGGPPCAQRGRAHPPPCAQEAGRRDRQ